jgi:hypothetical protein
MKTFYSAEDIENFAEQGRLEIRINENIILTDLAKQTAHMLGMRLMEESSGPSSAPPSPRQPQPHRQVPVTGNKPRGCQRRPADKPGSSSGVSSGQSRPVVDKLVEKIRRINR